MPELVSIQTAHFECVIWAKNISSSQQRLQQTMDVRNKLVKNSVICFQPAIDLLPLNDLHENYQCDGALFFENKLYDIEFIFDDTLKKSFAKKPPEILHRLKSIEDAFHYSLSELLKHYDE